MLQHNWKDTCDLAKDSLKQEKKSHLLDLAPLICAPPPAINACVCWSAAQLDIVVGACDVISWAGSVV